MISRPFAGDADLRRMQALQQELWPLERERTQTHVGDLAWWATQHAGREQEWKRQLWLDGDRCVAWAWLRRPASLDYEIHVAYRGGALHDELLDWFEGEADDGVPLDTFVMDGDDASRDVLVRRGFTQPPDAKWYAYFVQSLTHDASPHEAPDGFVLRGVRGKRDLRARVEVHRAVWAPSRVTEESYRNVMRTWPYRPDLDCVLEAPDGTFAAYTLCWYDDANRVGELEPVGVHPDFQRRGFGTVVCRYALARLHAEGAEHAVVYAANDGTCAFYESLGFRRHTTDREVRKERA